MNEWQARFDALMATMPEPKKQKLSGFGWLDYFFSALKQFRYEHPYWHKALMALVWCFSFLLVLGLAYSLSFSKVGEGIGLESARHRAEDAYYAMLWATRSTAGAESKPIAPERFAGTIDQVVGNYLVVKYYSGRQQHKRLAQLANVIVSDNAAFTAWAKGYALKGLTLDFYTPIGQVGEHEVWGVVFWHNKEPINVRAVEVGAGTPEKNPPTAVVNQIFSQFYWQRAKAGREH